MNKKQQIVECIKAVAQAYADNPEISEKVGARAIGTMIFDISVTFSGMISTALIDQYGYRPSVSKLCVEHFHSRQQSGVKILEMVANGEDITDFIDECTTVHYTTSHENHKLSQIQNDPETKDIGWEKQYELCGITLVRDVGTMPRKMLNQLKRDGLI